MEEKELERRIETCESVSLQVLAQVSGFSLIGGSVLGFDTRLTRLYPVPSLLGRGSVATKGHL